MASNFKKLRSAYLMKFFQKKNLPLQQWKVVNKGSVYTINNHYVIQSILAANDAEQELIVESLKELEDQGGDINVFLKQLTHQSHFRH